MINLRNKVALITGASSGIGAATASLFSNLGSSLVLVARNEKNLDETIKSCKPDTSVFKVIGDVTNENILKNATDECIKRFGKLDILVNNVGFTRGSNTIETLKIDDFDKVMNVNVRSIIQLTQLCVPHLIKTKGNIVNVSSVSGTRSFANILAYGISKAALDQFTKSVALELADKGVRVNSVNPGVIVTNFHKSSGYSELQYKAYIESCNKSYPLGRVGNVNEVANTIAFLASDAASFVTGELIHVAGGKQVQCPR